MKKTNKTFMKGAAIALASLMAAGSAFAQSGIAGGKDGLHQINAQTLGQWNVSFGVGGSGTADAWSITGGGVLTKENGQVIGIDEDAMTADASANFAIGATDWLDLGANLPIHFDYATDPTNYTDNSGLAGAGIGDLDIWAKLRFLGGKGSIFTGAILAQFYVPTGDEEVGLRPRHAWYLHGNCNYYQSSNKARKCQETMAYSNGYAALGGGLVFSLDLNRFNVPVRWNGQASIVHSFADDAEATVLTYSTGVNIVPLKAVDFFLEFSGEMRLDSDPFYIDPVVDPMLITPGARFHINKNMDLALGVDIAARLFKNLTYDYDKELDLTKKFNIRKTDDDGKSVFYQYASTPLLAASASMVFRFGGVENTEPNTDSLIEARANQLAKAKVDSIMGSKPAAKVDTIVKADTVAKVDTVAKIDTIAKVDTVKVIDSAEVAKNQAKMDSIAAVSAANQAKADSLAAASAEEAAKNQAKMDSIAAASAASQAKADSLAAASAAEAAKNQAKMDSIAAASAASQAKLDSLAKLSADDDKDGVPNMMDKCPETPASIKVGADGCEVDTDNDGIVDSKDQCASTNPGAVVDSVGCEYDDDADGVLNSKDQCENTLSDVNVDEKGCATNKDEDLTKLQTQIKFKKATAKINRASNKTLDKLVKLMVARPNLRIEVQGHCDEMKNPADNQEMSVLRAQAVVDYLVKKGVPSKYVRAVGFGDTKLLVQPKMNSKGKKAKSDPKNNRVEFAPHVKGAKKAPVPAAEAPAAAPAAEQAAPAATAPAAEQAAPAAAPAAQAAAPQAETQVAPTPAAAPEAAPAKAAPAKKAAKPAKKAAKKK